MIGAVGSIVAGVLAASSATANLARVEAPGSVTRQLQAGRYSLWAPSDRNLTFYDVVIEGPAGTVEYRPYGFFGSSDAIVDGGATYRSDGFFEPPVAGSYTVTLTDDGQDLSEPTSVLVGPGDGYGVTIFLWSALGVLVSGIVGVVGLILVIVGVVRRNRARRQQPPPGWSPQQPGYPPQPGYPQPSPPPHQGAMPSSR